MEQGESQVPGRGIPRQTLVALIEEGLTIRQIGARLGRHERTVSYWLARHGLKTERGSTRGRQGPQPEITERCRRHGEAQFIREGSGSYRCVHCRSEAVSEWRRRTKRKLVSEAGGRCRLCGYDRCTRALHFHHTDPEQKEFGLARGGVTRAIEQLRVEAAKCVLLCSNCHAEVEAGFAELPKR
jgi:transposase